MHFFPPYKPLTRIYVAQTIKPFFCFFNPFSVFQFSRDIFFTSDVYKSLFYLSNKAIIQTI